MAYNTLDMGAGMYRLRAIGFDLRAGRLAGLRTEAGNLRCDMAAFACVARSAVLARQLGDRSPLESERGYHVDDPRGPSPRSGDAAGR